MTKIHLTEGGSGSGNFGHGGRPGKVGGSSTYLQNLSKFQSGLSSDQKDALDYYGSKQNYKFLNDFLRGKAKNSDSGWATIIKNIDSSMVPIDSELVVFRGIKSSSRKFKIGSEFEDKAFVSTSIREWNANMYRRRTIMEREPKGGTLFRIKIPKGYPVAYLNFYNDQEILLKRGTKFRVTSNKDRVVDLEIVV